MSFIPGRLVLSNHAYCKNNLLTVRRHYFSKDLAFLCTNLLIKTHDGWFGVSGHRFAASLCFVRQQWSHSVRKRKQGIKGLHLPGEQAPAPHSSIRFLPPPCSDTVNIESTASKKKKPSAAAVVIETRPSAEPSHQHREFEHPKTTFWDPKRREIKWLSFSSSQVCACVM